MKKPSQFWLTVFKRIGLVLVSIVILLTIFVTFFLKGIVNNRLKKEVEQTFGDFYTLSFDKSSTSLSHSGFNIAFHEVAFESDTSNRYMLSKYPALFFKTSSLKIIDINIFDLFLNSAINVNNVSIEEPELLFFIPKNQKEENKDSTQSSKKDSQQNMIQNILIKKFELTEGKASFVFHKNITDTLYAGTHVNVTMENLGMDLTTSQSIYKTASLDQLQFSLQELLLNPKGSDYRYKIGGINFDFQGEKLLCYGLEVIPKGDPYKMATNVKYRTTIFDVKMDTLEYWSDQFESLKNLNKIEGKKLKLVNLNMKLDRNKEIPLDESRYKKLFHQSLMEDVPLPVALDEIEIKNATIDYKIHQSNEPKPGNLLLTQLDGTLKNVYSEPEKGDTLLVRFNGQFMKAAPFSFNANLPLKDPTNHSYYGHIESMKFTDLNPLIENLSRVKLDQGTIQRIEFSGHANKLTNWGKMKVEYNGLKLKVTDKQNKSRWLQSGVGNLLVRNNNKTSEANEVKTIDYTFERPPYKDHLTLYAGGLIEGFGKGLLPKVIYNLIMPN